MQVEGGILRAENPTSAGKAPLETSRYFLSGIRIPGMPK
jgi:hypothetical protein